MLEVPSRLRFDEGQRRRRRNWVRAAVELPGVAEGDMLRQNGQRKHGTTPGSPRRTRTAKASHINRSAAKLRCAQEWDACGRLSVDGLGQHNPDRSEATGIEEGTLRMVVHLQPILPDSERELKE